jgi:hypothetical protein
LGYASCRGPQDVLTRKEWNREERGEQHTRGIEIINHDDLI